MASGTIGQVHRARLRPEYALDGAGGNLVEVAVKTRHPWVLDEVFVDLDFIFFVIDKATDYIHMSIPFDKPEFSQMIRR